MKDEEGWTVGTLLQLMNERDRRYEQRFSSQEEAVRVYKETSDKWQAAANEWRGAMTDRERNFLSKGMGYVVGALSAIALILTIADKFR
jgi:hypothetical protein